MEPTCPDCLEGTGDLLDSDVFDSGVKRTFECDSCGHVWDVVF